MKYFIDTEFIEGFHKPLFGKRRHFIDLISIGIVAKDGREYYAISNEFNPEYADEWVKENVIYPIIRDNGYSKTLSNLHGVLGYSKRAIREVQRRVGKSNEQIAKEIYAFCRNENIEAIHNPKLKPSYNLKYSNPREFLYRGNPEFYAYYADYDWVVFCSLFGRMIDLPKGFPMYCRDLKQILDEKAEAMSETTILSMLDWEYAEKNIHQLRLFSTEEKIQGLKLCKNYPKQQNEHSALDDARWNKKLYEFLKTV